MRAPAPEPSGYERRRPEDTDLHRILTAWLPAFLERAEAAGGLPAFVVKGFESYLECGVLERGFARVRCPVCQDDLLVGFSCGGRGLCPSCCGRRMADTAAHLVDRVIPRAPVRQWVLTVPFALRPMLAFDAQLASEVGALFVRTVGACYQAEARQRGIDTDTDTQVRFGAVTAQQRAGSALNLNLHYHSLLLDGVYHRPHPQGPVVFRALSELTDDHVRAVLHTFRQGLAKLLIRRGLADDDMVDRDVPPSAMEQLTLLAVRTPAGSDSPRRSPSRRSKPLCSWEDGFTLHANTRVARHRRAELEVLCKYVTRPAVTIDQVRWRDDGLVGWRLKRPWSDGTTELCFEPLSFLGRLATLIPAPYSHQLVYHGVLAPAAKWRPEVVEDAARAAASRSGSVAAPSPCADLPVSDDPDRPRPRKLSWAQLMWRSLALDVLTCPRCGNPREVIALVRDPGSIRDILGHLGLLGLSKPSAPRGPPQLHLNLP